MPLDLRIDMPKLLRTELGEVSLAGPLEAALKWIAKYKSLASTFVTGVHDTPAQQATATFTELKNHFDTQAKRTPGDYVSQRDDFIARLDALLNDARVWTPAFVAAAVEERGLLEDEGIRQAYREAVTELEKRTATTLAAVKEQADKAVADAKQLADEIEAKARRTATKISIKEAQDQFRAAKSDLDSKVKTWGGRTIISLIALALVPAAMMIWDLPSGATWPVALYHTLLRILVLSAVVGASAFCIRMLRAFIHLREKNEHRIRVANSVESFVNSALEPQQRDLILAKFVDALVDFGDSGLIRGERDDASSSGLSGDTIGRILAALSGKDK